MDEIPGYPGINPDDLPEVKIIDALGVLRGGYRLLDGNKDRGGLIAILDPDRNRVLKAHPKRVCDADGSMAIVNEGQKVATCPRCSKICVADDDVGVCECGRFPIAGTLEGRSKAKVVAEKKQAEQVDLKAMAAKGELWLRKDVPFDNGKTRVTTVSLRIKERYISFNLYNGSFGKKSTAPPIEQLENGEVGYVLKNRDKWVKKLQKKGYKPFT